MLKSQKALFQTSACFDVGRILTTFFLSNYVLFKLWSSLMLSLNHKFWPSHTFLITVLCGTC